MPLFGPSAADVAAPQMIALVTDNYRTRDAAAYALGKLRADPTNAVPELIHALRDPYDRISWEVIEALHEYGPAAADAVPVLLQLFEKAVANADPLTSAFARTLLAVSPDAPRLLRAHLRGRDPELLRAALDELAATPADAEEPPPAPKPAAVVIPLPRAPR